MFSTACYVVGVTVHTLDFDAMCGLLHKACCELNQRCWVLSCKLCVQGTRVLHAV